MKDTILFITQSGKTIPTKDAIDAIADYVCGDFSLLAEPKYNDKKVMLDILKNATVDGIVLSYKDETHSRLFIFEPEDYPEIYQFFKDRYFRYETSWELLSAYRAINYGI